MGRQARAVHSSRSVSTFASVALVPAPTAQPRRRSSRAHWRGLLAIGYRPPVEFEDHYRHPGPRGGLNPASVRSRTVHWLIITAHTQLRLARPLASDLRRPWERSLPAERLTPARVRRGFRYLRAKTSQPASAPKPSHPGPGRPPGTKNRVRAIRYDVGKTVTRDPAKTHDQQVRG